MLGICVWGGNILAGPFQVPWQNTLKYDYSFWIDSDVIFQPSQVSRLINRGKDIMSGLYLMDGGEFFATVATWDENFFNKNGYFQFLTKRDIELKTEPFKIDYTGLGFMAIKYGVFESLEYPWFRPVWKQIGNTQDFTMEDVSFCHWAREKGFDVWVDPTVIVGHLKDKVWI